MTGIESGPSDRRPSEIRRLDRLLTASLRPVDVSSLVVFRIAFGLVMALWSFDSLWSGRVHQLYVLPRFHFTYYPFDFVRPLPGSGMYVFVFALGVLAICIATGFLYRAACLLFASGFTYFFLLERTNYQNHYYLICLISWLLTILPLNRAASLDVLAELTRPSRTVPAWCLWLVQFHVALPYVFGGLSKLQSDWLAGEPLRTHLGIVASQIWIPSLRPLLVSEVAVTTFVWGGLLFDLAIVPLLIWRRTRTAAYLTCLAFHLTNAWLFNIHIFPWFMILATTIFFAPDWPSKLLGERPLSLPATQLTTWHTLSWPRRAGFAVLVGYCLLHVVWPLRCHFYPGDVGWTERGHYFSWRMMLRVKDSAPRFYVTDSATKQTGIANLRPFLNIEQVSKFSRDPEMILQFAHFLAEEYRRSTGRSAQIRALVLTSLNGRKPELLIDPNIDLAQEPRGFYFRRWINPQTEPLRKIAWNVPMADWERYVAIPPLKFLNKTLSPATVRLPPQEKHSTDKQPPSLHKTLRVPLAKTILNNGASS